MPLSVLEEQRTFPPKLYFLVIWIITFLIALFGLILNTGGRVSLWVWSIVSLIALRQIWMIRWVDVDQTGITTRNIVRHRKSIRWDDIESVDERELPVRKKRSFQLVKIKGRMNREGKKGEKILVDSDTVGFETFLEILHTILPDEIFTGGRSDEIDERREEKIDRRESEEKPSL